MSDSSSANNSSFNMTTPPDVSITSKYVFNPVPLRVKLGIVCPSIAVGLYNLVANSLILYFMYKKSKMVQHGSFRRLTTDCFISSLALSDVLCSLLSLPVFASDMFVDYIKNDGICMLTRYMLAFFPIVTSMNYLCIGIERVMMIYFPYVVPSKAVCRKFVLAAWLTGAFIVLIGLPAASRIRFDLSNSTHTMVCMYDKSVSYRRMSFIACLVLAYIIPVLIHVVSCILITRKMRQHRAVAPSSNALPNHETARETTRSINFTNMFMFLIFAFIIPYMLFVCYNAANILLNFYTSFTAAYALRMIGVSIMYANGAVGSTILFCHFPYLRSSLLAMFRDVFPRNEIQAVDNEVIAARSASQAMKQ